MLFASQSMLHRVMPAHKGRWCFTMWLSGRAQAQSESDDSEGQGGVPEVLRSIQKRKLLAKVAVLLAAVICRDSMRGL